MRPLLLQRNKNNDKTITITGAYDRQAQPGLSSSQYPTGTPRSDYHPIHRERKEAQGEEGTCLRGNTNTSHARI